ncbi:hypothetical protein BGP_0168 [Beggiatoa sp. PS]|nr:hypothetical protein BGP_0168 [Beggiatoa sp. PS]
MASASGISIFLPPLVTNCLGTSLSSNSTWHSIFLSQGQVNVAWTVLALDLSLSSALKGKVVPHFQHLRLSNMFTLPLS